MLQDQTEELRQEIQALRDQLRKQQLASNSLPNMMSEMSTPQHTTQGGGQPQNPSHAFMYSSNNTHNTSLDGSAPNQGPWNGFKHSNSRNTQQSLVLNATSSLQS
jgi:hypothetical protein